MKWRKNLGAKLAIIGMSVLSLVGGWTIVRQQTPTTDAATTITQGGTTSTTASSGRSAGPQATPTSRTKAHTRTRVS